MCKTLRTEVQQDLTWPRRKVMLLALAVSAQTDTRTCQSCSCSFWDIHSTSAEPGRGEVRIQIIQIQSKGFAMCLEFETWEPHLWQVVLLQTSHFQGDQHRSITKSPGKIMKKIYRKVVCGSSCRFPSLSH